MELLEHQRSGARELQRLISRWGGAVLADVAGSGKTLIALEVAASYFARGSPVWCVVPAMLKPQWRHHLGSWSATAEVVSHDELPHRRIFPGSARSALVIVDEAHRFRNAATARYRALAALVVEADVLLVTATPVWNRADDFLALIELFASDDRFAAVGVASLREAFVAGHPPAALLAATTLRRSREDLTLDIPAARRRIIAFRLPACSDEVQSRIEQLQWPMIASQHRTLIGALLIQRLTSSVAALQESLSRQSRLIGMALQRGVIDPSALRDWRASLRAGLTRSLQQALFVSPVEPINALAWRSEMNRLNELQRMLAAIPLEPKLRRLLQLLQEDATPALLFTESIATARRIHALVRDAGMTVAMLTSRVVKDCFGRVSDSGTELERFRRGTTTLLVCTDIGSEGLNLQSAARVIHYDLPWTHVRMEQRSGRARRLGSMHERIEVLLFIPSERLRRQKWSFVRRKRRVEERLFGSSTDDPVLLTGGVPRIGAHAAQVRLFRRLASDGLLDHELRALLMQRYPAGVEAIIAEMAGEATDLTRLTWLGQLLRRCGSWRQRAGW